MRRSLTIVAAVAGMLVFPATAYSHAALLRTVPQASGIVNTPPKEVALTYSEAVEPRFAIVSVTDPAAHQETTGPPRRSPNDPDTLLVPLRHVGEGWYLVYWRAISVDGHPVRGAFTFAVGPNPGPAPQFVIPSISETAATPKLLIARWLVFLSVMGAVGLAALRLATARPVIRRVPGATLRGVTVAFAIAAVVGLVSIPIYVMLATADFALRSFFSFGALIPLVRASAFGRGYIDLWICFGLFVAAAVAAIRIDRPEREQRSVAELLAIVGVALAGAAALLVPGLAGHAAQTAPRGLSLLFDWVHLAAGSIWVGGLIGLLVLWRNLDRATRVAGLVVVVPRFSNTAFVSVMLLIASGVGASLLHVPTVASLWQTSYGQALLVKVALLLVAMLLAAVNLLRTKPRLAKARGGAGRGETARVALSRGRRFSSPLRCSPPRSCRRSHRRRKHSPRSAERPRTSGRAPCRGPSSATAIPSCSASAPTRRLCPTRSPSRSRVAASRSPAPTWSRRSRCSTWRWATRHTGCRKTTPGVYRHAAPALVMVGHWGLVFNVTPRGHAPFDVLLVDKAAG